MYSYSNAGSAERVSCMGKALSVKIRKDTIIDKNECGKPDVTDYGGSVCLSQEATWGIIIGIFLFLALAFVGCKYYARYKRTAHSSTTSSTSADSHGISLSATSSFKQPHEDGDFTNRGNNSSSNIYYPVGTADPASQAGIAISPSLVNNPYQQYSLNQGYPVGVAPVPTSSQSVGGPQVGGPQIGGPQVGGP